ncbi:hypothetical protein [Holdemania massiliensis]|nr:hypothetical protein [Holdemania massiliensis]
MLFPICQSVQVSDFELDLSGMPSLRSAKLISVTGSGKLTK